MKKAGFAVGLLAIGMAIAVAATWSGVFAEEDEEGEGEHGSSMLEAVEILAAGSVTPQAAVTTALGREKGTAVDVDFDVAGAEGARHVVWEIEILGAEGIRKVCVDLKSGEVVSVESDDDAEELAEMKKLVGSGKVDLGAALAALRSAQPGLLMEMDLEDDDGTVVYEAKLVHGGKVLERNVDPATGKVTADDEDEDHESGDEDGDEED